MSKADVGRVRITYWGQFDWAQVNEPQFLNSVGVVFEPDIPVRTRAELKMFLMELLELRHPCWANAEGACGWYPVTSGDGDGRRW